MQLKVRSTLVIILGLLSTVLIGSLYAQSADTVSNMAEIAENAAWSENVTISINEEEATFTFESDGLPADIYGGYLDAYVYKSRSGNGIAPPEVVEHSIELPLIPLLNDAQEFVTTNQGTIGVIISGAVLYNPFEGGNDTDVYANDDNFYIDGVPFIDSCGGHPAEAGRSTFHYHGIPYCVTDVVDVEGEHSVVIGYLFDGFPIYGPQGEDGEAPDDLNDCNAHFGATPEFPDGTWHYHLTDAIPYSIECYIGVTDESLTQSRGNANGIPNNQTQGNSNNQSSGGNPPPDGNANGGNPPPDGNPPPQGGNGGNPPPAGGGGGGN